MWNGLALFLIVNLLKPDLGLDLIDPRSSWFNVPMARGAVAFNGTSCVGVMNEADSGRSSSLMSVLKHMYQVYTVYNSILI